MKREDEIYVYNSLVYIKGRDQAARYLERNTADMSPKNNAVLRSLAGEWLERKEPPSAGRLFQGWGIPLVYVEPAKVL